MIVFPDGVYFIALSSKLFIKIEISILFPKIFTSSNESILRLSLFFSIIMMFSSIISSNISSKLIYLNSFFIVSSFILVKIRRFETKFCREFTS